MSVQADAVHHRQPGALAEREVVHAVGRRHMHDAGKLALLAGLAVLLGSAAATATEPGSYEKALARAEAEDKLVVLDFYTDW